MLSDEEVAYLDQLIEAAREQDASEPVTGQACLDASPFGRPRGHRAAQ